MCSRLTHLGGERYVTNFLNWNALRNRSLACRVDRDRAGTADVRRFGRGVRRDAGRFRRGRRAGLRRRSFSGLASSWRSRIIAALLTAFLAALPFLLHLAAGGDLPARTLVAVPAVMWLLARLGSASPRRALAVASVCAIAVAAVQSLVRAESAADGERIRAQARRGAGCGALCSASSRSIPARRTAPTVDIYGEQRFDSLYPRPTPATMGYSFFEWDGGNAYRITAYMHLLGYPQFDGRQPAAAPCGRRGLPRHALMACFRLRSHIQWCDSDKTGTESRFALVERRAAWSCDEHPCCRLFFMPLAIAASRPAASRRCTRRDFARRRIVDRSPRATTTPRK